MSEELGRELVARARALADYVSAQGDAKLAELLCQFADGLAEVFCLPARELSQDAPATRDRPRWRLRAGALAFPFSRRLQKRPARS